MSVSVIVAGVSYQIPTVGENSWGPAVTSWIQAISANTLQTSGGLFSLSGDLNFGPSFGLISNYYTSTSSNAASSGVLRLANNDSIKWRNAANSADIGLKLDNTNTFQFGAAVAATNLTGTNSGDVTLAAVGSSPNANGASLSTQALTLQPANGSFPGVVTTAAQTFAGSKTFSAACLFADGTLAAPGMAFSSEPSSGLFRNAAGDVQLSVLDTLAINALQVGSNINFGFGAAASAATNAPLTFSSSLNNVQFFTYANLSNGTSSGTVFNIQNGTSSGTLLTLENYASTSAGYLGGGALVSASFNQLFLNVMSEYSAGAIRFNVGGRTLATERMNLSSTVLTLNKGVNFAMGGSSSGVITFQAQAAAGTYNFNLPITVGTAGQVLTSQAGGSSAMTWTTVLTSPMTTLGDMIVGGASGVAARLAVGSNGQFLGADSTATNGVSWQSPINFQNFLINGAFDIWQAGTSATLTAAGSGAPTPVYLYQPDQWYVKNILGGGTIEGIVTFSQVAGVTNGSMFGAKAQITTAPTGTGIQNGLELYQVLSNKASTPLYNKTASFTILIKALGNVNQVGVQFYYATTEAKLTNSIGSEVLTTVNSSTFSSCTINGQALGTTQTVNGVIGVRIRPTAVSTGNLYDLNNGIVSEQAMLNLGPVALPFSRQYNDPAQELASAQYFYEVWGTQGATTRRFSIGLVSAANTTGQFIFPFKISKRMQPTATVSAASHFTVSNSATSVAATAAADNGTNTDAGAIDFTLSGTYAANSALTLQSNTTAARIFFDARI